MSGTQSSGSADDTAQTLYKEAKNGPICENLHPTLNPIPGPPNQAYLDCVENGPGDGIAVKVLKYVTPFAEVAGGAINGIAQKYHVDPFIVAMGIGIGLGLLLAVGPELAVSCAAACSVGLNLAAATIDPAMIGMLDSYAFLTLYGATAQMAVGVGAASAIGVEGLRVAAFAEREAIAAEAEKTLVARLVRGIKTCVANSFSPDTSVLLADGTSKRIHDIHVGDEVLSTDPTAGITGAREVSALHRNQDTDLADVQIRDDRGHVSTIHTTQRHPFWDAGHHAWAVAKDLVPGEHLETGEGVDAAVVTVTSFTGNKSMDNRTVDGIHTYYVLAGRTPVLVHNAGPCGPEIDALSTAGKVPDKNGLTRAGYAYQKHMGRGQLPEVPGTELDSAGQNLLDSILTDPYVDFQLTSGGGFRVIGKDIVSPWKGLGVGNDYFVGATFTADGKLDYFGVYR